MATKKVESIGENLPKPKPKGALVQGYVPRPLKAAVVKILSAEKVTQQDFIIAALKSFLSERGVSVPEAKKKG